MLSRIEDIHAKPTHKHDTAVDMEINNAELDEDQSQSMEFNSVKLSSSQKSFLARKRLCFTCGTPGHKSSACTIPADKAKSKLFSALKGAKSNHYHRKSNHHKYKSRSGYKHRKCHNMFNNVDIESDCCESDSEDCFSVSSSESEYEQPSTSKASKS